MATENNTDLLDGTFVNRIKIRGFKSFRSADLELPSGFIAVAGPNGSGKCVRGDTLVMTSEGKLIPIKELVEKKLKEGKIKKLDDGFFTTDNKENDEVFTINPKTLKIEKKKIYAFVKRTSPSELYTITTKSGKQITTTNDHPIITMQNGQLIALKVEDLKINSPVALPRFLEIRPKKIPIFSKLIKYDKKIYLYNSSEIREILIIEKKLRNLTVKKIAENIGIPELAIWGLLKGQNIKLHYAYKLLSYFGYSLDSIYNYTKYVKGASKKIRIPLYLNENIAYILGLILAEGRLTKNELFLSNNSESIINYFTNCMNKEFECNTNIRRYNKKTLTLVSSSPLIQIFNIVFNLGIEEHASKKKIPPCMFSAQNKIIESFLTGLYDGDGHISDPLVNKIHTEITFASKDLSIGVMFLLNRLNIIGRYSESEKCATNTKNKIKRKYYRVSTYGLKNILKFTKFMKLQDERKANRLKIFLSGAQLVNNQDTNVDLIPNINELIKLGLKEEGYTNRILKQTKPSKIRAYFENRCYPTRKGLIQTSELMSNKTPIKDYLKLLANSDIFWDSIKSIDKIKGEKWVYDLTIKDNHNFFANGLFVHNSNLSDSIRFVLGELGLKSLRAKKTSELVFMDSKEAAVTLYAGNKKNKQVEIKRAINPEGKTIYKLNGKKTTRTSILDTIRPMGLELGDHNVIAQGQIQKIVEMSSKERRGILDGVAGISEFEDKKKESMRELDKVQQKINDASIVLGEREGFLNELEKEKDAAIQYKKAQELFKRARGSLIHTELIKFESSYEKAIEKLKELNGKIKQTQEDILILDKRIKELETKKSELTNKINKDGKRENLVNALQDLGIKISVDSSSLSEKEKETIRINKEKERYIKEKEKLKNKISSLDEESKDAEKELKEIEKQIPKEVFQASTDLSDLQLNLDKIIEEKNSKKEILIQLSTKLENIEEMISVRKEGLEDENIDTTTLFSDKEVLEKDINSLQKEIDSIFEKEKQKNRIIAEKDKELLELKGRAADLRPSVKGLTRNSTLVFVDEIKSKLPGVYGTVSELITFDPEYTEAIQGAAAGRLDYVVVEDIDTAAKVIEILKKQKAGRCTFIPLDRRTSGEKIPQKVKDSKGFVNSLTGLIRYDSKFYNAIEYAFGSTAVVDSITTAKKLNTLCKIVTMSGEVFYPSGILTGGSSKGSLAAKMKLEKIEKTIEVLSREKSQAYSDLEDLREQITKRRKERVSLELKYREVMIELGGITKSTEKTKEKAEDIKKALNELEKNKKELLVKISSLNSELESISNEYNSKLKQFNEIKEKEKEKQQIMKKQYEGILSEITDKRTRVQTIKKEKELLEENLNTLSEKQKETEEYLIQIVNDKKHLEKQIKENKKKHEELENEMKKISKKIEHLWEEIKVLDKELEEISQQKGKLLHSYEKSKDSLKEYEINKATSETRLIDLKAEYENYKEIALIDASKEKLLEIIKENETKLNLLGEVNLKAPELFEEKKAEITEVKERVEKLKDERSAVLTMIEEIDSKKKRIFMETFHKINDKFKDLFGYVFEGEGLLILDKPNDPFESGLQMKIKKGNKYKYIDSMSGGEKSLLALIFIFSIQMTKPASFYLLDEAEAALDKDNSRKMAELIKKLSKDTQFFVITHNDEVLKSADVALGVTMTDKGSQILGIELNEKINK